MPIDLKSLFQLEMVQMMYQCFLKQILGLVFLEKKECKHPKTQTLLFMNSSSYGTWYFIMEDWTTFDYQNSYFTSFIKTYCLLCHSFTSLSIAITQESLHMKIGLFQVITLCWLLFQSVHMRVMIQNIVLSELRSQTQKITIL